MCPIVYYRNTLRQYLSREQQNGHWKAYRKKCLHSQHNKHVNKQKPFSPTPRLNKFGKNQIWRSLPYFLCPIRLPQLLCVGNIRFSLFADRRDNSRGDKVLNRQKKRKWRTPENYSIVEVFPANYAHFRQGRHHCSSFRYAEEMKRRFIFRQRIIEFVFSLKVNFWRFIVRRITQKNVLFVFPINCWFLKIPALTDVVKGITTSFLTSGKKSAKYHQAFMKESLVVLPLNSEIPPPISKDNCFAYFKSSAFASREIYFILNTISTGLCRILIVVRCFIHNSCHG